MSAKYFGQSVGPSSLPSSDFSATEHSGVSSSRACGDVRRSRPPRAARRARVQRAESAAPAVGSAVQARRPPPPRRRRVRCVHTDLARLRRPTINRAGVMTRYNSEEIPHHTIHLLPFTPLRERARPERLPPAKPYMLKSPAARSYWTTSATPRPVHARAARDAGAMSAGASHHAAGRCCTVHPFAHASPHQIAIFPAAHGSLLTPHFPHAHTPIAPQRLPAGARGAARSQRPGRPTWPAPCPCSACRCRRTS